MQVQIWTAFGCGLFIGMAIGVTLICILVTGRQGMPEEDDE